MKNFLIILSSFIAAMYLVSATPADADGDTLDFVRPDTEVRVVENWNLELSEPLVTTVMSARDLISEDHENVKIEEALFAGATVMENVSIFAYVSETGITASELYAAPNVSLAVDPAIIPFGSDVLIDWGDGDLQYCRADDVHSDAFMTNIGLCVGTTEEVEQMGTRTATIYVIPQP